MYLTDIETDLARADASGFRQAFLALAAREDTIIPHLSAHKRRGVHARVCEALHEDRAIMPSGACAELDLLPGSTYAEGVARVSTGSVD